MKKIMLMGRVSCGKTTLCQCLAGMELRYQKTQTVQLVGDAIDTPGEYVENRALMRGLTVTAVDADAVLFLQDCTDPECRFSPGQAAMYGRPVVGVVTKTDLAPGPPAPRPWRTPGRCWNWPGRTPFLPSPPAPGRGWRPSPPTWIPCRTDPAAPSPTPQRGRACSWYRSAKTDGENSGEILSKAGK